MTAFENTAATLTVQSGYTLGLVPGTKKVVTDIKGWYPGTAVRRESTPRMAAHGNFAERGYREARFPSIGGTFTADSRAEAAAFVDEINAFLGDGTEGVLTIDDADLGTRSAAVYLAGTDVVWDGGLDVVFYVDMEAPDPRKYGEAQRAETGIPAPGGGLAFPLFSSGIGALARTNLVPNPSFENGISGVSKAGAITLTQTAYAPMVASGSQALSISIGAGAGIYSYVLQNVPASEGDWLAFTAMLRWSGGSRYARQTIQWKTGSGNIKDQGPIEYGVNNSLGGVKKLHSAQAPAGTTSADLIIYFYDDAAGAVAPASGSTWSTDSWLAVLGTSKAEAEARAATYFDGDTGGMATRWTGTPGGSPSEEYSVDNTGALDFGTATSDGIARLTNHGTAESPVRLTVHGPADNGFTITQLETGRKLVYTAPVLDGQRVVLDSRTGTVKLNGYADRAAFLVRRDWITLAGGESAALLFEAPESPAARLELEVAPAWW